MGCLPEAQTKQSSSSLWAAAPESALLQQAALQLLQQTKALNGRQAHSGKHRSSRVITMATGIKGADAPAAGMPKHAAHPGLPLPAGTAGQCCCGPLGGKG